MSIQVYYTSNWGSLRSFGGCYGPKNYTQSIYHDFIEFCDPENIGIDMSLDVVGAVVFVLWRFLYFRVMAATIGPPGGQNVQKSLILDHSAPQYLSNEPNQKSLVQLLFQPHSPHGGPGRHFEKGGVAQNALRYKNSIRSNFDRDYLNNQKMQKYVPLLSGRTPLGWHPDYRSCIHRYPTQQFVMVRRSYDLFRM